MWHCGSGGRTAAPAGYHIPHAGMFRYVSGANFLGEIVEWAGFALASVEGGGGAGRLFGHI